MRQMTGNTRYNHNRLDKAGGKKRKNLESRSAEGDFEKAIKRSKLDQQSFSCIGCGAGLSISEVENHNCPAAQGNDSSPSRRFSSSSSSSLSSLSSSASWAPANALTSSISAATNDNTISPQAANDDDGGDNDEIDDELEAVEELIAEAIRSKYEANSAKARIKALKKKMSVLQSAVFSAQGTNTVRQALKKIKKKPDAWKKLEFVVAAASSLRVTMEGHVDAGDILAISSASKRPVL